MRIHIERVIGRLKLFKVLDFIPYYHLPCFNDMLGAAAFLTQFLPPLVREPTASASTTSAPTSSTEHCSRDEEKDDDEFAEVYAEDEQDPAVDDDEEEYFSADEVDEEFENLMGSALDGGAPIP